MNIKRCRLIVALTLFLLFLSLPAFAPPALHAQTAAEMDAMLAADSVSAAGAARFVLAAADLLQPGLSGSDAEQAAYDKAKSNGWIRAAAGENVTMQDTSFLIMKAFNLKGGVMYSLFENPRYAYREMVYRKLILGRADAAMKVTGPKLLYILDKTLSYSGEDGGVK